MGMLPRYRKFGTRPFEPINEVHVHSYTMQQLFVPTAESRHFTREDAAEAFHPTMLSVDARTPHKEYIAHIKRVDAGMNAKESEEQFRKDAKASEDADTQRQVQAIEREKRLTTVVQGPRTEFRIKKIQVDDAGKDGRSRLGVGWRYGAPLTDRQKGAVKHRTVID